MTGLLEQTEKGDVANDVQAALGLVRACIERAMISDLPPVQALCDRLEGYRGKMLRPTLTLLSGLAFAADKQGDGASAANSFSTTHITIGAVVEMVHLATLVHDDVLDDADTRRQSASINRICGNEAAVILGDYLISASFHLCSTIASRTPSLRIGQTTGRVCEGELLQLHHRGDFELDEATYFKIIERKTASLIGVACELGAWASGASETATAAARLFGDRVGAAFQIRDDLLDLTGEERVVGKTLGRDLAKGKLTLPVIHHLRSGSSDQIRQSTLEAINHAMREPEVAGRSARAAISEALDATGSIVYATQAAQRLISESKRALASVTQPSQAQTLLLEMADSVLDRDW